MTNQINTVPLTSFMHQIEEKLVSESLYSFDWFNGQRSRVSMMWNAGETVDSAYETIRQFAAAQLGKNSVKHSNPLSGAKFLGFKYID